MRTCDNDVRPFLSVSTSNVVRSSRFLSGLNVYACLRREVHSQQLRPDVGEVLYVDSFRDMEHEINLCEWFVS